MSAFSCGEDWGIRVYWLLGAICQCTQVRMTHQLQAHGRYCVTNWFYQKQVSIKRFLTRNLADVGMSQCMNALADKVHKQVPCTQWYARTLHNMARLFNNHPSMISSKFSANWIFFDRDGCWIMWPCYGVHAHITVHGTSCLCTLSASVFMHWDIPTSARFLLTCRNLFWSYYSIHCGLLPLSSLCNI